MPRLGISIYPEKSSREEIIKYIETAHKYGFSRLFTCLLSAEGSYEEIVEEYSSVLNYANGLGFECIVDVAPAVFDKLHISYEDLSFFKKIGASGIRLDEGFDGHKEAVMTRNKYGLKIEFNASILNDYITNIISYQADSSRMISCHNFYPQKYSGLGLDLFNKCTKKMHDNGLKVAAFISSHNENTFGPWPITDGLCTLEMHRHLPLDLQARHLLALGVDDIIIANCFASETELKELANIDTSKLNLKIEELTKLSEVEKEIVYDYEHYVRPDMSDYMARSTFSRITYKDAEIKANNVTDTLKRGDVVVLNEHAGRYKGELHIILEDMPNEGDKNLIGRICTDETFMLKYLVPFTPFKIIG